MADNNETREGLQFFGRISASVTHEIKNVFAVINESAGLVGDFTLMAERGMPIEPEKLKRVADAIQGQIRRGDTIVKNMNAFSHSTDEPVREVNLVEQLTLTVALTKRFADMKQVGLAVGDCEPVALQTSAFDLMRLLHSSIAAALELLDAGDTLSVSVKPLADGASFSLSVPGKDVPIASDPSLSSLAQAMGASLGADAATGAATLYLSRRER